MINAVTRQEIKEQLQGNLDIMAHVLKSGERLEVSVSRSGKIKIYGVSKHQAKAYTPDINRG